MSGYAELDACSKQPHGSWSKLAQALSSEAAGDVNSFALLTSPRIDAGSVIEWDARPFAASFPSKQISV